MDALTFVLLSATLILGIGLSSIVIICGFLILTRRGRRLPDHTSADPPFVTRRPAESSLMSADPPMPAELDRLYDAGQHRGSRA